MSLNETWPIATKDLLDSSPWQFHGRVHDLLIVGSCCCIWTVIVCVTAFKLAHLLKSIIVSTSDRLVIFCIWALISVDSCCDWGMMCPTAAIILGVHLQPIGCLGDPSWITLRSWLLSVYASIPGNIHGLSSVVKPWLKHLPRLFSAMAPGLMLVHLKENISTK